MIWLYVELSMAVFNNCVSQPTVSGHPAAHTLQIISPNEWADEADYTTMLMALGMARIHKEV